MNADTIARLKITLDHVTPVVLRRIEVPLALRLHRLHLAMQTAMGWTIDHRYEIRARDAGWGIPNGILATAIRLDMPNKIFAEAMRSGALYGSNNDLLDARRARLIDVIEHAGTKTLKYVYDSGGYWQHTIIIERLIEPVPGVAYPRLIEATGRCPPEDVGGPRGYAKSLEATADPNHERRAELHNRIGGDFDPNVVDADGLANAFARLTKRWSRKPAAKRKHL
jgi:hypothetical protein